MEYRKYGNFNSKNDSRPCIGASAFVKSVDFRAFEVNVKTVAPKQKLYQSGHAIWWYTVPMAIHSFLEEYDFSGKTIVPFVTHGTGGFASTIEDIKENLPDSATVLEPIGVYRPDVDKSQPDVNEWLNRIGFSEAKSDTVVEAETAESDKSLQKHLTMTVDGQKIEAVLYDTPAANKLYEMLPLELKFEDYNSVEKIAYLPETLPTGEEGSSFDPDIGDVCLYAPWGNLSIFYQNFPLSNGLFSLGHIESGMAIFTGMDSDFTVIIEKAD